MPDLCAATSVGGSACLRLIWYAPSQFGDVLKLTASRLSLLTPLASRAVTCVPDRVRLRAWRECPADDGWSAAFEGSPLGGVCQLCPRGIRAK